MSRYAKLDDGSQTQVASLSGWGDFCGWVRTLPLADFPLLQELAALGETQYADQIGEEIGRALEEHAPADDIAGVGEALLSAVESASGAQWLGITEGTENES